MSLFLFSTSLSSNFQPSPVLWLGCRFSIVAANKPTFWMSVHGQTSARLICFEPASTFLGAGHPLFVDWISIHGRHHR
ncbi:hypothetical protein IWZ03DRAFT_9032 [Phyllosticta citriasiana]|uniref:Secreted protein n=1 Tax=Phyllosticta citriasiana TaxID=595635 RepID=A0ABR1KXX2_9PEZI